MSDSEIAALLREREGYLVYGRLDRAAQVDAELIRRGFPVEQAVVDPAPERAVLSPTPSRPRRPKK